MSSSTFQLTAMPPLKERDAAILRFIMERVTECGAPPSAESIAEHFELKNTTSVFRAIKRLRTKGYLATPFNNSPMAARRIRVLADPEGNPVTLTYQIRKAGNA